MPDASLLELTAQSFPDWSLLASAGVPAVHDPNGQPEQGASPLRALPLHPEYWVARCAEEAVAGDAAAVTHIFMALSHHGWGDGRLALALAEPVAQLLGKWWEADRCSFWDVTLGVGCLASALRELSGSHPARSAAGRRVLVGGPDDQQHTLGTAIVSGFLRRAGWSVDLGGPLGAESMAKRCGRTDYDLIALSVCRPEEVAGTAHLIQRIRDVVGTGVPILVGGWPLMENPEARARLRADGWASDAPGGLRVAEALVARARSAQSAN
jgi:methanogenic corrinoid protein MtbC1